MTKRHRKPGPGLHRRTLVALRAVGGYCFVVTARGRALYVSEPLAGVLPLDKGRLTEPNLTTLVHEARTSGATVTRAFHTDSWGSMRDLVAQAATIEDNCVLVVLIDRSAEVEATQARRDFVSNVGHELVTPVTSLRLIAQALTASAEDPAMVRDFAGRLTRVTTQLDHMTASMLTLARAQEAPLPDQMRPIDIGDVIDKAVATLANEAEHAGIKLQRKKRGKAVVMGDADALETAVENLVSNAIHYSPSGGRVTITTGRDDSAGTATISVVDQGIGVDPAEQDRIFERFYRTDSARARRTGGTGLGLAIVKHTALAHGGSVRVDSRPGIGSTFALILPQAGAPDTEEEA